MNTLLISLFKRDLERLKTEVSLYNADPKFWEIKNEIQNSAGNLTLHIIGNLNHFVGAILGNTGYIRNREGEFNDQHIAPKDILKQIDALIVTLEHVISSLTTTDFDKVYPVDILKKNMSTAQFLLHLYGHLNYHLGQINYHRRLLN